MKKHSTMLKFIVLALFLALAAKASRLQIIGGREVDAAGKNSLSCIFLLYFDKNNQHQEK